jgi:hypothetical protein
MRRIFLGAVAVVALFGVAAAAWVLAGERLALFFDRFTTLRLESLPMRPLSAHNGEEGTYYPAMFLIGQREVAAANLPEYKAFPLTLREDQGQLELVTGGKSFRLGPLLATTRDDVGRAIFSFEPEPQDKASFTLEKSLITWPTPLETNFMSGGPVASWRRFLTYRLVWRKQSGAELEMVWRYRQDFIAHRGWIDVFSGVGSAGLIKVRMEPAGAERHRR